MTTSFKVDFTFSQVEFAEATPCQDRKQGVDYFLAGLPIAYRKRRFPVNRFNDLALRYSRETGNKTECDKLMDGSCMAKLYVFEFQDCWVLCPTSELVQCLRNRRYVLHNGPDGEMACIKLQDVIHFLFEKDATFANPKPQTSTMEHDSRFDDRRTENEW